MKSLLGMPGTKPRANITSEVGIQAADKLTCLEICSDMLCAEDTLVTIIAVAMDNKLMGFEPQGHHQLPAIYKLQRPHLLEVGVAAIQ